jgi:hypothetical protein
MSSLRIDTNRLNSNIPRVPGRFHLKWLSLRGEMARILLEMTVFARVIPVAFRRGRAAEHASTEYAPTGYNRDRRIILKCIASVQRSERFRIGPQLNMISTAQLSKLISFHGATRCVIGIQACLSGGPFSET